MPIRIVSPMSAREQASVKDKKKGRIKKMGGGMIKKPMMKKGGMAKLNPGLKAFLMKKKKKKKKK